MFWFLPIARSKEVPSKEVTKKEVTRKWVTGKEVAKQEVTRREVTGKEVTKKEVPGKEGAKQETAEKEVATKEPGEHEVGVGDKQKKKTISFCGGKDKNSRKSKKSIFKKKDAKEASGQGGMEVRIIPIHIIITIFFINIIKIELIINIEIIISITNIEIIINTNIEIIIVIPITRFWRVARSSTYSVPHSKRLQRMSWSSKHLSGKEKTYVKLMV